MQYTRVVKSLFINAYNPPEELPNIEQKLTKSTNKELHESLGAPEKLQSN